MLPNRLVLNHFLYKKPHYNNIKLFRVPYKKNTYSAMVCAPRLYKDSFLKRIKKDLLDAVFVCKDTAYKAVAIRLENVYYTLSGTRRWKVFFTVEEYTDTATTTLLLERLKRIKEQVLVCTDCVEELGSASIAAYIRNYIETTTLEDLV